jgi:hypothetical protein
MRLAYYDERVIETMADAIALDGSHTVADVGTGPDSSPPGWRHAPVA